MWHHWQGWHDEYVKYSFDDLTIVMPCCAHENKSTTKEPLQNTQKHRESHGDFEVGNMSTPPWASENKAFLARSPLRK